MEWDAMDSNRGYRGRRIRSDSVVRKDLARSRHRRGIALIWTALVIIVMVGMAGLAIDYGKVVVNLHQMHNGADAASLAGAQIVMYSTPELVIDRTYDIGAENGADRLPILLDKTLQDDPILRGDEEIILGRWVAQERKFYPTLLAPNAVRVIVYRNDGLPTDPCGIRAPSLTLLWGPIFGTDRVTANRFATARSLVSTGAGIICLADDPTIYKDFGWNNGPTGFLINGGCAVDLSWTNADGEIIYGDIQVNAISQDEHNKAGAVKTGSSGTIVAGNINVVGSSNPPPEPGEWDAYYDDTGIPFSVNTDWFRVEDPLWYLNPPENGYLPDLSVIGTDINGNAYTNTITTTTINTYGEDIIDSTTGLPTGEKVLTLNPGYYPGGIDMTGGNIVLNPGEYSFGGANVTNNAPGFCVNGGSVTGDQVLIYVTGDPDGSKTGTVTQYGEIDIGGNGHVELTSRGDYLPDDQIGVDGKDGVVIWQDINNHNQANIIGTPGSFFKGTMYFPDNPAQVGGGTDQLGAQIICGALQINGNIDLGIAYDGRNQIKVKKSGLVE